MVKRKFTSHQLKERGASGSGVNCLDLTDRAP